MARFRFGRTGGAIGRVANADTVFAHRDSNHDLLSFVSWKTSEGGAEHEKYLKSYWSHVEALSLGFYVNDLHDQSQEQVNQTCRENFPRLLKVMKQYDPTNLFRLNANIRAVQQPNDPSGSPFDKLGADGAFPDTVRGEPVEP